MKYYIVIAAHNEQEFIGLTLDSLLSQTLLPSKIVVVNDNSSDQTGNIVTAYAAKHPFITLVEKVSDPIHMPGSKVIKAFNTGAKTLDNNYDVLVKLDADLILPKHYFETIARHFNSDATVGMAGGFAYIEKNGDWILENLTNKDHIRGAFKAYRKEAYQQMGGLVEAMGWDTADELICQYNGWKIKTDASLHIKHLKPTGANYNPAAQYKQGEAFYTLGYGTLLTVIASLKLAVNKKNIRLFWDYMGGFYRAKSAKTPQLVTAAQGAFIRKLRWRKIREKVFKI